jgi:predicted aspartyl protease
MKFPRPRQLLNNSYPDLAIDQPQLIHRMINQVVNPQEHSDQEDYIQSSITYLKNQQKLKNSTAAINSTSVNNQLFYVDVSFPPKNQKFKFLVDTGASNSIIHTTIAEKMNLPTIPAQMKMTTATGTTSDAIVGTTHIDFALTTERRTQTIFCTNFIVSNQLAGMNGILGAEFLMSKNVHAIATDAIIVKKNNRKLRIPIQKELPANVSQNYIKPDHKFQNEFDEPDWTTLSDYDSHQFTNVNHNIREYFDDETLPPSDEYFDNHQELDFAILDKTITLESGDYSSCPPEHLPKLMNLLMQFEDRFSKSKLDLETTTLYEAPLPTHPGRIVQQKVRRLPPHKYQFTIKAIEQLEEAGVVRRSDSEWYQNQRTKTNSEKTRKQHSSQEITTKQNCTAYV